MLETLNLSVSYNGVAAVRDVTIAVRPGEMVAIIGANGAGKSSLLQAIMGLAPRSSGRIRFNGRDVTQAKTELLVGAGLSLVPETRELFPRMSCRDNLRMGLFREPDEGAWSERVQRVFALFPRLQERLYQPAGTLSGGEQQMLAIGRALMQDPTVLLLDEPSLGLSPGLTEDLFRSIINIRDGGKAILLVEQRARMALSIADRGYLLRVGRVVRHGTGKELQNDEFVRQAYFGYRQ
ncbi:MAG: ABC transporter ATP-binding protein [Candidatus Brocadiia bacterium]